MTRPGRAVRMSYLVASVAGVAFFAMSVVLLGVLPGRALDADTRAMAPEHVLAPSPSEMRGRAIYGREGCAYCHTQQVRYLHGDMARFGAPTLAWETEFDAPQMWGTRRIGPDLAREADSRPDDWQLAHLFAPRSVVPLSIMPAYPSLFGGASDRPTGEGRDLVAYLKSLGRARELAWPEGDARARAACHCDGDEMAEMAFALDRLDANPARARRHGDVPALPASGDCAQGAKLYSDHCAGCHGASGAGDGPGAAGLQPRPTNLTEHQYARSRLAETLWNGVAGTAMPAWRDRPLDDLASIVDAVQALNAGTSVEPAPANANAIGARVYAANCVPCHGERGEGDGYSAATQSIAPTNFRTEQPSAAAALRALRSGVDGTPMAPWTSRLSDADIIAVAEYVRSLYVAGTSLAGGRQ